MLQAIQKVLRSSSDISGDSVAQHHLAASTSQIETSPLMESHPQPHSSAADTTASSLPGTALVSTLLIKDSARASKSPLVTLSHDQQISTVLIAQEVSNATCTNFAILPMCLETPATEAWSRTEVNCLARPGVQSLGSSPSVKIEIYGPPTKLPGIKGELQNQEYTVGISTGTPRSGRDDGNKHITKFSGFINKKRHIFDCPEFDTVVCFYYVQDQNIGKRYLQTTHNFVINKPFKASLPKKKSGTFSSLFLSWNPPLTLRLNALEDHLVVI
ncbi:hypothetical protein PROFUN_16673 [Planoprotostelium fungivorum]|uniref:Uncharacterized protein n=1 Tax=Planoprotostelium fungivorum TaxID=1890364 RepID=A0A2P6MPI9_9EUKA|nr:hypothetical protein PROFUN_16673 [Planoprotostelium fungivorum]